jgi:hemolysin activation/secretion protein
MPKAVVSGKPFLLASNARLLARVGWAAFLLLFTWPAAAQQTRASPIDPQQTEKHIDAVETERQRLRRPLPRTPKFSQPLLPSNTVALFQLNSVSVTGAAAISSDAIEAVYAAYIGRKVSQADLETIANGIGDLYRDAGFHLSRALIPPQDVKQGNLRIQVIEGSIAEIKVEGDGSEKYGVRELLGTLLEERPSRLSSLERKLLVVNDIPGLRVVDTALEEIGETTGRFRLTVRMQTWRIYTTWGLDNSGTHAVGPLQTYASTSFNSYLVRGDTLGFNLSTVPDATRDLRSGRVSYNAPVGNDGFRLGGSGSYSEVWPADDRRQTDTRTINQSYELRGSYSPIQTRQHTLTLTGSFGYTDEIEKDSTGTIYSDHIRVVRLAADYRIQDAWNGSNYLTAGLRHGVNALNATQTDDPLGSRAGATPNFSVFEYAYTRYQKLSDAFSIKASISGQLASEPLFSSQTFYLGGAAFGPGYYNGDNGVAGLLEVRFDQAVKSRWIKGYQLYSFVDGGQVWNRHEERQSLASVGAGIRVNFVDDWYASIGYAVPVSVSSKTEEYRSSKILFSLSSAFKFCPDRAQMRCF